jgi:hypothetical protein
MSSAFNDLSRIPIKNRGGAGIARRGDGDKGASGVSDIIMDTIDLEWWEEGSKAYYGKMAAWGNAKK